MEVYQYFQGEGLRIRRQMGQEGVPPHRVFFHLYNGGFYQYEWRLRQDASVRGSTELVDGQERYYYTSEFLWHIYAEIGYLDVAFQTEMLIDAEFGSQLMEERERRPITFCWDWQVEGSWKTRQPFPGSKLFGKGPARLISEPVDLERIEQMLRMGFLTLDQAEQAKRRLLDG